MDPLDLRDLMLEATAEVQEIVREVLTELAEPQAMNDVHQMWSQMPDQMKEQFASENPEDYQAMMDGMMKGRK